MLYAGAMTAGAVAALVTGEACDRFPSHPSGRRR